MLGLLKHRGCILQNFFFLRSHFCPSFLFSFHAQTFLFIFLFILFLIMKFGIAFDFFLSILFAFFMYNFFTSFLFMFKNLHNTFLCLNMHIYYIFVQHICYRINICILYISFGYSGNILLFLSVFLTFHFFARTYAKTCICLYALFYISYLVFS